MGCMAGIFPHWWPCADSLAKMIVENADVVRVEKLERIDQRHQGRPVIRQTMPCSAHANIGCQSDRISSPCGKHENRGLSVTLGVTACLSPPPRIPSMFGAPLFLFDQKI